MPPAVPAVRRLVEADALAVRTLRLQCLRDHPSAFTSDFASESAKPLADTAQRLSHQPMWGAFDGPELVGLIGLDRETRLQNRHKAHIVAVYVADSHRGRGLARQLLQAAIDHAGAQGVERLVLTVTQGNATAQRLYERMGFVVFGVEPDAIRVGGAALAKVHMGRSLVAGR